MAFTKFTALLAVGMLITGSLNTISTNFANLAKARGTEAPSTIWGKLGNEYERNHAFDHPFFQAACMFLGELLCLIAHFFSKKRRTQTPRELRAEAEGLVAPESDRCRAIENGTFWFCLPAICDMCGTGTMYAGLCLSYASVFQMLRGSVVVFTTVLSCLFLRRKFYMFQWFSVFLVVVGVAIVGYSSLHDKKSDGKDQQSVLIGDFLIIFAQLIVAVQMCVEEKIMSIYKTPSLKVVGLEGIFGFCILGTLLVPMYFLRFDGYPFENAPDALAQMSENWVISVAMLGNVLSIAFFNFFGISITKAMSASHRMVLDTVRNLLVWGFALAIGWEKFHWLQLIGFAILTLGISMYNEVITIPRLFSYPENNEKSASFIGFGDHGSFLAQADEAATNELPQCN
jgi:drug/metabolite transporter (DMT)-like permease